MSSQKNITAQPRVGVGIIVRRQRGGKEQILMHKRNKVSLGKGYWGTGGGHLELGESLMEGALRVLNEESGGKLKVANVRFLGVLNFTQFSPDHYVDVSFIADWISGKPENDKAGEAIDWQWFDIDKLPTPVHPAVARYLTAYKKGEVFLDS